MSLFRTPSALGRIATALERIATALDRIAGKRPAEYDEARVWKAVDERLTELGRREKVREAKTREGYANVGATTDEMIRQDLGLRRVAEPGVSHRVCSLLRSLFGLSAQDHGGCR